MSVFTHSDKTRRICLPAAIRAVDALLKIQIQVKVISDIKQSSALGAYVNIREGYHGNITTVGSPGHVKAVHTKIRCEAAINDLCTFLFPVIGVQNGNRIFDRINNRAGAKSRYDLIGTKFSQFIIIKCHGYSST